MPDGGLQDAEQHIAAQLMKMATNVDQWHEARQDAVQWGPQGHTAVNVHGEAWQAYRCPLCTLLFKMHRIPHDGWGAATANGESGLFPLPTCPLGSVGSLGTWPLRPWSGVACWV